MPGEEHHLKVPQASDTQTVRWSTVGSFDRQFLHLLKPLHAVEPTAPEHPHASLAEVREERRAGHGSEAVYG
jgi:hypothetical protein